MSLERNTPRTITKKIFKSVITIVSTCCLNQFYGMSIGGTGYFLNNPKTMRFFILFYGPNIRCFCVRIPPPQNSCLRKDLEEFQVWAQSVAVTAEHLGFSYYHIPVNLNLINLKFYIQPYFNPTSRFMWSMLGGVVILKNENLASQ